MSAACNKDVKCAYPFQITVNDVAGMKVVEAFGDVGELEAGLKWALIQKQGMLTRPIRLAFGCFEMYSGRSPPVIHSEMSWRGFAVTPRRGTIFLCFRRFHTMASW